MAGLFLFSVVSVPLQGETLPAEVSSRLRAVLAASGAQRIGASVVDTGTGNRIFGFNDSALLKPASVLKIVTTAGALRELSPDYRFETGFLVADGEKYFFSDGSLKSLFVLGGGDPSFTTEDLWIVVRALKRRGIRKLDQLVLDAGDTGDMLGRQGQRAYQAGSSPISLNFNSILIEICPSRSGHAARTAIDPFELNASFEGRVMTVTGGRANVAIEELPGQASAKTGSPLRLAYRLSGQIGEGHDCLIRYRSVSDPLIYFGQVLTAQLKMLGVQVGGVRYGSVPKGARSVYTHYSKPLSQVLEDLNHYSNNFTAEQILAALGGTGGRAAGLARLKRFLGDLGFQSNEFSLYDGSGLNHSNRVSAALVTKILNEMQKDEALKVEFEKALSVGGRNGTLKTRGFTPVKMVVRGKTGSLNGVSSLAGYVVTRRGRKFAYALLLNGVGSKDSAVRAEDNFVNALYAEDL